MCSQIKMIRICLLFCIFSGVLLQNISCQQNNDVIRFQPLNKNEKLGFEKLKADVLWDIQLYAENKNNNSKRDLYLFNNFEGTAFEVTSNDEIFFTRRDINKKSFIYIVDGKAGTINTLFEASSTFAIAPDGKYICFCETWNMMNSDGRTTTDVFLYDVTRGKILQVYDFSKVSTILLSVKKIYYDEKENCFITEIGYDKTIIERKKILIP